MLGLGCSSVVERFPTCLAYAQGPGLLSRTGGKEMFTLVHSFRGSVQGRLALLFLGLWGAHGKAKPFTLWLPRSKETEEGAGVQYPLQGHTLNDFLLCIPQPRRTISWGPILQHMAFGGH